MTRCPCQILGWCHDMGIQEVTVYAFSIENFKRSEEEVSGLLSLAREKFTKLLAERLVVIALVSSIQSFPLTQSNREKLTENGVCIRVLGDTAMLPRDLQKLLAETVLATASNHKAFLNVCFAYTSRAEVADAVQHIVSASNAGLITETDVSDYLLRKCFWSNESTDPDLVIRTSGETRLSDFVLWQSGYAVIAFVEKLWPEFTIWDLFKAVFFYQRHCELTTRARLLHEQRASATSGQAEERRRAVVSLVKRKRLQQLQTLVSEMAVQCA